MLEIPCTKTTGGMSFRDHERIMFAAQRAEARGEFKDMLLDESEVPKQLGNVAVEGSDNDTQGENDG
jgi:hypothetical protein